MELGKKAASDVAEKMRELLAKKEKIRIIFAAGESQMTFLDALAKEKDIDWQRIVCFDMDEFYEPKMPEKFTCGYQITKQLLEKVNPGRVYLFRHDAPDPQEEAKRFTKIMQDEADIDILCQGIGTSGHLAFNEPYDTDFEDSEWVKVDKVAEQSKRQLVDDPNFKELGFIPSRGITMTIPTLFSAKNRYTMVPLSLKRPILTELFKQRTPTVKLPASILSTVAGKLYVDKNSCPEQLLLEGKKKNNLSNGA